MSKKCLLNTNWTEKTLPTTSWTERSLPATAYIERALPSTTWEQSCDTRVNTLLSFAQRPDNFWTVNEGNFSGFTFSRRADGFLSLDAPAFLAGEAIGILITRRLVDNFLEFN